MPECIHYHYHDPDHFHDEITIVQQDDDDDDNDETHVPFDPFHPPAQLLHFFAVMRQQAAYRPAAARLLFLMERHLAELRQQARPS